MTEEMFKKKCVICEKLHYYLFFSDFNPHSGNICQRSPLRYFQERSWAGCACSVAASHVCTCVTTSTTWPSCAWTRGWAWPSFSPSRLWVSAGSGLSPGASRCASFQVRMTFCTLSCKSWFMRKLSGHYYVLKLYIKRVLTFYQCNMNMHKKIMKKKHSLVRAVEWTRSLENALYERVTNCAS